MTYNDLEYVVGKGEELTRNWRDLVRKFDFPQRSGWYFFEKDAETGLNQEVRIDRSKRPRGTIGYKSFRALHRMMFDQRSVFFKPMRTLAEVVDGSSVEPGFTRLEHITKQITNECEQCGDCALADLAYLCPSSQCAKNQRNGPCGGSFEGWCEKYPNERKCVYVRAYERLKSHSAEDSLGAFQVPPVNYDLYRTSSWINYFLGRDHSARLLGVSPAPFKAQPQPETAARETAENSSGASSARRPRRTLAHTMRTAGRIFPRFLR